MIDRESGIAASVEAALIARHLALLIRELSEWPLIERPILLSEKRINAAIDAARVADAQIKLEVRSLGNS